MILKTSMIFAVTIMAVSLPFMAHADKWQFGLEGFTQIKITAGLELRATIGPKFLVYAEGDKREIELLNIYQNGKTLVLDRNPDWKELFFPWSRDKSKVLITVTLPEIQSLSASAGSQAFLSGTLHTPLMVTAKSGALLSFEGMEKTQVQIEASSGAIVSAKGTCTSISATASSGAMIDTGDLICKSAVGDVQSGGIVVIYGSDTLSLYVSSGGILTAKGGGVVKRSEKQPSGILVIEP